MIHTDDRAAVISEIQEATKKNSEFNADYRIVRPDGAVRYLNSRGRVEVDYRGRRTRRFGVVVDVTEEKATDQSLAKKTAYLVLLQKIAVAANEAYTPEEAIQVGIDEVCSFTAWPVGHAYMVSDDSADLLVPTKIWHIQNERRFNNFKKVTEQTTFDRGIAELGTDHEMHVELIGSDRQT